MRILLVDDEEELVETLAERLSLRGMDADWTNTGEKALDLAGNMVYDVAVLDVKMPGISGFALKKKLQEILPDMKFIFLTGHGSEDDFRECVAETGKEYYLVKPIAIEVLIQKINSVLQEGR